MINDEKIDDKAHLSRTLNFDLKTTKLNTGNIDMGDQKMYSVLFRIIVLVNKNQKLI